MPEFSTVAAVIGATGSAAQLADCLARIVPFVDAVFVEDSECDPRKAAIASEYGATYRTNDEGEECAGEQTACVASDWLIRLSLVDRLDDRDAERIRTFLTAQPLQLAAASLDAEYSTRAACDGETQGSLEFERTSKPASVAIDVIVLSYAKTRDEYDMTRRCVETLWASEQYVEFNIVVVETNTAEALWELGGDTPFDGCRVIHPREPFNYNRFLQIGFAELHGTTAEALLILNNDLVFEPGFASHLLRGLEQFDSVTPWCPDYHERRFDPAQPLHEGFRTTMELCGWAIMFRKELLKRMAFEELFPDDFSFWFQDNYYGHQLERIGARHALVTAAKVHHLYQQSHELIDPVQKTAMTGGAEEIFDRKVAADREADGVLLTIAVPSIPERLQEEFPRIYEKLCGQAEGKPVEVLALVDNKRSTLGAKRNALTDMARGRFLVFCDDDDDVADSYVDQLLSTIRRNPETDCVAFDAWVTVNGEDGRLCKYSREFDDVNRPDAYYRRPNQICCFRTEVARREKREDVTWGEDSRWAARILPHVRNETRIDETLYYYDFQPENTACPQTRVEPPADPNIRLTIGVLSVPARIRSALPQLFDKLNRQAEGKPVEILAWVDNKQRSVGAKRNDVLEAARGAYIAFVDDDDDVADEYVDSLLAKITNGEPDCVVFDAWVTQDGRGGKRCRYGIEFEDQDGADEYLRRPNHLCCVRTDLAREVGFADTSWHEDFGFAAGLQSRIKQQVRISRTLYHYQFSTANSETYPATQRNGVPNNGTDVVRDDLAARPVFGFYHIATMNHWREVVDEQLLKLKASGLYDRTQKIFVGVVGPEAASVEFGDPKFEIMHRSPDLSEAEFPTLSRLHQFCRQAPDSLVYYLHTKGVSHADDRCRDWRRLMEHFDILHFGECIAQLADHDVAGVNWHPTPSPHFSGNFWWARSEYLAGLPPVGQVEVPKTAVRRLACEQWVGRSAAVRAACLHRSHVNHYHEPYPRGKYAELQAVEPLPALDRASAWRGLENRFQDLVEPIGPIRTIVEIGVDWGFSLFSLATACPQATVIGVDPYGRLPEEEAQRLGRLGGRGVIGTDEAEAWVAKHLSEFPNATLLRCTGKEAAELLGSDVDVVHIDSVHAYDDIAREFATWEPKLRPGGCILVHDTRSYPNHIGRFFNELPGRKAEIRDFNGLGAWYKPDSARTYSTIVSDAETLDRLHNQPAAPRGKRRSPAAASFPAG